MSKSQIFERDDMGRFASKKEEDILLTKKLSTDLAEIIGIMLGDGSIYTLPKSGIYQVHVAGNMKDEKEYLLDHVKPLFEKTFKVKMSIKYSGSGIYVWKQSKDLVFTFEKYGLKKGNKKVNNVKIPEWIMKNDDLLKSCLRGIFDTDGCVYPKNNTNLYPAIWISSAIPGLRNSIATACNKLGFNLTKWKPNRNDACIDRKAEVLRFYSEIGFNNHKHLVRWKKFNRLPSSSPVNQMNR